MDSSDVQQRKQRRMESNRESARLSRVKKQKYMDDLTAEAAHLSHLNNHISNSVNATTQQCVKIEVQNSVLRAHIMELSHRLHSLKQILTHHHAVFDADDDLNFADGLLNNSLGPTHHY